MQDSMGIRLPEILGKMYPNGEFVIWRPRCTEDSPLDSMPKVPGVIDYMQAIVDSEFPEGDFTTETVGHLGLSLDPILNLPPDGGSRLRAVKGLSGITSHGRRMLRNGAYLLEREYPKEQLSFLTLTMPSFSMEEGRRVQSNWSELMQHFKNAFAKKCRKEGLSLDYVYCVEIQSLRSRSAGWPVLHIHMLFVGRNSPRGAWRIKTSEIDAMWKASLEHILRTTVDVKCACNVQQVKKSAESYLSKYLSKGCGSMNEWREEGLSEFFPPHWWGMSSALRARVRGQTYYGETVGLELEKLVGCSEHVEYVRTITIKWDGHDVNVGKYGRLKAGIRSSLGEYLDSVDEMPF